MRIISNRSLNLETAVGPSQKVQDFESESLAMGVEHSHTVKATPIASGYGSKDCAFRPAPTAVFRLKTCWSKYPDCRTALALWEERIKYGDFKDHHELKLVFPDADYIPNKQFKHLTIFNIKGNRYRLAVDVFFNSGQVFIKWFGQHKEYDKVDFSTLHNGEFSVC
jgi:mRNA interferase HigB